MNYELPSKLVAALQYIKYNKNITRLNTRAVVNSPSPIPKAYQKHT